MASITKSLYHAPPARRKPEQTSNASPAPSSHRKPIERTISVSEAKTHLLALVNEIDDKQQPVIITKRGRPVARIIPIESATPRSIFGCMKDTFQITGDVVGPEPDVWEALR